MRSKEIRQRIRQLPFYSMGWTLRRLFYVSVGAVIAALGYSLFQVPFQIAAGGLTGIGIIINHFTGWPVGALFLIMNIPLLIVGFPHLGRWRFLSYTLVAVAVFSASADLFTYWLPQHMAEYPITHDMLLAAIYAGIVFGIGNGLIYRMGGTIGGTNITGRLIQIRTGLPLSQSYLYSDGLIIFVSGLIFGWESALHAMLTLFIIGMASDFVIEGPSFVRTATIITNHPREVTHALMYGLHRGASQWEITGAYSGQTRFLVFCTIYRSQMNELKQVLASVDENAFLVIGNAHQALGAGFLRLKR